MSSSNTSSHADIIVPIALAAVISAAIFSFAGGYAIDDSYIGFSNAQNLAAGRGFVFTPGQPALSTSAPLAVFVYAALYRAFHADIVQQSQVASGLSIVAIAFFSYAIVRRFTNALVAGIFAVTLCASPLVLLLWSHESLPALALLLGAVYGVVRLRYVAAALMLGIATLLRPECFIALPFLAYPIAQTSLRRAAIFCAVACAPFLLWIAYALPTFGTFVSQSLTAKQAQLYYGGTPYLRGLIERPAMLYVHLIPIRFVRALFMPAVAIGLVLILFIGRMRQIYLSVALWTLVTTVFYLFARIPFYYWFALQVPIAIAALAAALTWERLPSRMLTAFARSIAALIVGLNFIAFAHLVTDRNLKYESLDSMLVMPHVEHNNYYRLALWIRLHTEPAQSIAYPEIGQLRYYSDRPIIDDEGLSTPGVARQYMLGNPIWPFERYRPSVFVDEPGYWKFFANPTEYDWFFRAYRRVANVELPGTFRNRFVIYRLTDPAAVPRVETPDNRAARSLTALSSRALAFRAVPSLPNVEAFEVRATGDCAHGVIAVRQAERTIAARRFTLSPAQPMRVRIPVSNISTGPVTISLTACRSIRPAPPTQLRGLASAYWSGTRRVAPVADALTVYDGS